MENELGLHAINNQSIIDESIHAPYKIGKLTIDKIISKYTSRKLSEDIDFLNMKGGYSFLEDALKTSLKEGLNESEEDRMLRISEFDSNEPVPEDPLSTLLIT